MAQPCPYVSLAVAQSLWVAPSESSGASQVEDLLPLLLRASSHERPVGVVHVELLLAPRRLAVLGYLGTNV